MAEASAGGMTFIRRANRPVTPLSAISALAKINTPIASLMESPCRLVASSAAPGVDQAQRIGMRVQSDSPSEQRPIAMPSIDSQPPIIVDEAPAACAA